MPNDKNLKPWKKGQSGNPKGAALHDPLIKAIRRLSRAQIAEMGTLVLECNWEKIQEIAKDPNTPALKMMMASVVGKAIAKGDAHAMAIVLEQIVGKVKEKVEHSGSVDLTHFTPDQIKRAARLVLEADESE